MEQYAHNLFADAYHYMFGGMRTSMNEPGESAGTFQLQSSQPMQPDREAMFLPGSPAPLLVDEDVDMLPAVLPSTAPHATVAHPLSPTPHLSQSPSLPPSDSFATSSSSSHSLIDPDLSHLPHPFVIDDDARSDASMPSLFDASDSESGEDIHQNVYDFMSESEADAHDVEMTLLVDDDGNSSDSDDAPYLDDIVPPPSDAVTAEGSVNRHVTVEDEQNLPQTDTVPSPRSATGPQPGTTSHVEPHSHVLPHHLHAHPHPHPHPPLHQHLHPPHPPQFHAGIQLPTFPGMPGLRAQGQGDGQVPLPGLRTLFQPLIVEAVAQAGERLRTAQGRGNPGQGPGPTTGPDALPLPAGARTGVPVVQVTFNVPVFRLPPDARPRQQQQTEAQQQAGEHERAAPLRTDNPNAENPAAPNAIPDGLPNPLRQFIEALDFNPNPTADGAQAGPSPALTGLLGLLFGLGLGSPELHREDPVRAKRLVKGLEKVNVGLVKRMRKISEGSADGAICAICWDTLLEDNVESADVPIWDAASDRGQATDPEPGPSSPPANPEEPLPRIVALPCSHVFHGGCLVPWFSRPKQTTCPTCRFNVDPDNLTYEPPRRPQPPPPQQRPTPPQPVGPTPPAQPTQQQESSSGAAPPPQQAPFPLPQTQRRTIFEHTFTIPYPPPPFPFPHPQPGNHGPQPGFSPATDPFSPVYQRMLHTLRQFTPPVQHGPLPPLDGAPAQEAPAPPSIPQQPSQVRPPVQGQRQGLQPPPQDANANGMPRFPGLFQFELPQVVHMPDNTWLWAAPLGDFSPPMTAAARPPHPPAPPRTWAPPPPPGLTLRQRVEQGEREKGLRCDDVSCGVGPSDDDPEPTADLARVVIHAPGEGNPACTHAFHPACLVSAERVAGWAPENERERTDRPVEVSCPVCRAVGAVLHEDWEKGVEALAV